LQKYNFDAYIVGSDQVWRPRYSPCITNYFLDFIENTNSYKKIAYAASFGVDNWEFTSKQTKQCSSLAKKFDAIFVREHNGIHLCSKFLGVNAVHVLDPTMLLDKDDYIQLVKSENEIESSGNLMIYILDSSEGKQKIIETVSKELSLIPFSILPNKRFTEESQNEIDHCVIPSVTSWLRGFMDANFVITDSFHGCIFSIIFNKPFIAIGNKERGLTRFISLLNLFELEDRLIILPEELSKEKLNKVINFERVNQILNTSQHTSFDFLNKAISNSIP
jgi:polysaccharide pyruvyl transferase WcaK-like protein